MQRQSVPLNPLKTSLGGCHLLTRYVEYVDFVSARFAARFTTFRLFLLIIVFRLFAFRFGLSFSLFGCHLSSSCSSFSFFLLFLFCSFGGFTFVFGPYWAFSEFGNLDFKIILKWASGWKIFLHFLLQFVYWYWVSLVKSHFLIFDSLSDIIQGIFHLD